MKRTYRKILRNRKNRIERRLQPKNWEDQERPMFGAHNIQYEMAERTRGMSYGGIGAMHVMLQRLGLVEDLDQSLSLLRGTCPIMRVIHNVNAATRSGFAFAKKQDYSQTD